MVAYSVVLRLIHGWILYIVSFHEGETPGSRWGYGFVRDIGGDFGMSPLVLNTNETLAVSYNGF
jgi:hypothetical protein